MNNNMLFKMSVRFYAADHKVFGPGIAQLLHRVQKYHSLRAAALSMDMAYSKAWTVLRTAEEQLGFKLLHSSTGGKGGGGAVLSPEGDCCWSGMTSCAAGCRHTAHSSMPSSSAVGPNLQNKNEWAFSLGISPFIFVFCPFALRKNPHKYKNI